MSAQGRALLPGLNRTRFNTSWMTLNPGGTIALDLPDSERRFMR